VICNHEDFANSENKRRKTVFSNLERKTQQFKCSISEINSKIGKLGMILKLMPIDIQMKSLNMLGRVQKVTRRQTIVIPEDPPLHFVFDPRTNKYTRQLMSDNNPGGNMLFTIENHDKSLTDSPEELRDENGKLIGFPKGSALKSLSKAIDIKKLLATANYYTLDQFIKQVELSKRNYATGIVTRQLINGKSKRVKRKPQLFKSIFGFDNSQEREEKSSEAMEQAAREMVVEKAKIAKVKAKMRTSLDHFPVPEHINNLKWVSLVLIGCFSLLTILEYILSDQALIFTRDHIDISWMKGSIFSQMGQIYTNAMILTMVNENVISNYDYTSGGTMPNKNKFVEKTKNESRELCAETQKIILKYAEITKIVNDDIASLLWKKNSRVGLFDGNGSLFSLSNYTLYETMVFINEAMGSILRYEDRNITYKNQDVMYIRYNYLNAILVKTQESRSLKISEYLVHRSDSRDNILIVIMCIGFGVNLLSGMLMLPFLIKAKNVNEESLSSFLCIPRNVIGMLQEKCEKFLTIYDSEKDQEDDQTVKDNNSHLDTVHNHIDEESSSTPLYSENENSQTEQSGGKRRFQRSAGEKLFTLLKVLFVMAVLDAYFVFAFIYVKYLQSILVKRLNEITYAADLVPVSLSGFATYRENKISRSFPVLYDREISEVTYEFNNLYLQYSRLVLEVFLIKMR